MTKKINIRLLDRKEYCAMFEQIQSSIQLLVEYLIRDSERYYTLNGNELHIFKNAVNSGGYEKYLQAVYASVKGAYLGTKVFMEFPTTASGVYPKQIADIAYIVNNTNEYYCIEELKCYSNTMGFECFLEKYKQDIMKVVNLDDQNGVKIGEGYVVGFMALYSMQEMENNLNRMISDVSMIIYDSDLRDNVCHTPIYTVDGLYFCAVITRAYIRN